MVVGWTRCKDWEWVSRDGGEGNEWHPSSKNVVLCGFAACAADGEGQGELSVSSSGHKASGQTKTALTQTLHLSPSAELTLQPTKSLECSSCPFAAEM